MLKTIKNQLRKSWLAINIYRKLKNAIIFPLKFTSYGQMQLKNVPLKDFLNIQKIKLINVVTPYTKNGYMRLANIYDLAEELENNKLPGAFVECGTWRGGSTAIMGGVSNFYGSDRKIWYFDSFEGMPSSSPFDGDDTEEIAGDVLRASVSDVEELIFRKLHLPKENNIIVKGWFEDVLPRIKDRIGKIALLRLDADWYEATRLILNELYDRVVPGGYIIFDDYGRWQGCKKAVDDFLREREINPEFKFVGNLGGVYGDRLAPMYFKKN